MTVSAWVKLDSSSNQVTAVSGYTSENSTTTAVLYNNNSSDLAFYLKDDSGTATRASSSVNPSTDIWYLVTRVYDGSDLRVFVDGIEESSVSQSYSEIFLDSFRIGEHPYNGDNLHGSIDDVRIYDRALSRPEIKALYERTQTQKITDKDRLTSGLVGHWPLNEEGDGKAYDLSGRNNDSTSVTGTSTAIGLGGAKARRFDGSSYIDTGAKPLAGRSEATMSVFVKFDALILRMEFSLLAEVLGEILMEFNTIRTVLKLRQL